jgi:hypothetical protein
MKRALLALALVATPAFAGGPADLAVDHDQPLLAGRLTVKLPAAMAASPRGHSVMSADQSGEDETRALMDLGKARFVMMAYEPYLATGGDFATAVAAEEKAEGRDKDKLEPLAVAKPLVAIAALPPPGKGDQDANLVLSVWIASPDHTAQLVEFYVNPDGAKDTAQWLALARKIAKTLTAGKRTLDIAAGERKLGSLAIKVPAGWSLATQQGPDFTVYHLRSLGTLGGTGPSTCGVYLGGFPSYQYKQADVDPKTVKASPGKLLGASVQWQTWGTSDTAMTEAMAPHGSETVHVFCAAKTAADLAPLRAMVETLH